nr:hypothetical protein [Tanacetum cinerariifolium]
MDAAWSEKDSLHLSLKIVLLPVRFIYNRGATVLALEGQSREAINAGNAGWTPLRAAIVPNFHIPMHNYEVKNMYLMALLNLSARYCDINER